MTTPALRFTGTSGSTDRAAETGPAASHDGPRQPLPALGFRAASPEAVETPAPSRPKPSPPALHFLAGPPGAEDSAPLAAPYGAGGS
jgi:hypothetical protein